jgi:ankyrin repeat protein
MTKKMFDAFMQRNYMDLLKCLRKNPGCINSPDDCGGTILMYASGAADERVVLMALAAGAKANLANMDGEDAMGYLLSYGEKPVVRLRIATYLGACLPRNYLFRHRTYHLSCAKGGHTLGIYQRVFG